MKGVHTNCDSLLNKRDELDLLINGYKPRIILLTEILPKNVCTHLRKVNLTLKVMNGIYRHLYLDEE